MIKEKMKFNRSVLATACLALTLTACSSDSKNAGLQEDQATTGATGSTDGASTAGTTAGTDTGATTDGTGSGTGTGAGTDSGTTGTTTGSDTSGAGTTAGTTGGTESGGTTTSAGTDGSGTTSGADTSGATDGSGTTSGTDTSGTSDGAGTTTGADTTGTTDGSDTSGTTDGAGTTTGSDTAGTTGGSDTGGTDTGGSTGGEQQDDPGREETEGLPDPRVPVLDPLADPIPSPSPSDPFGAGLEFDGEPAVAGGPPTQPKNLRLDLVSNTWAEFSWAPSNDDGEVVQYIIERSDGVTYTIQEEYPGQEDLARGTQAEIAKIWATTSFIDCNYTRFEDHVHECSKNGPEPGDTFQYTVKAVDDEGQESAASEPLSITYLLERNAPVPLYRDPYKGDDNRFASENDLSAVDYWIDDFDLVFSDEFKGDSLDPEKWQTSLTWGDNKIINGEQQYFVNTQRDPDFGYDPFKFTGESLIIEADIIPDELREKLPPVCDEEDRLGVDRCEFLSGALSTYDRFQFIYGYTEGRFKVSGTPGALSSFYLYHRYPGNDNLYHAPEIDIIEYLGENPFGDPDAFQTYHFTDPNTGVSRSAPTMSYKKPDGGTYADNGEWHTFGVLWEPQLVIWYIDGREVKRMFGPQVSRQPMNIVNYLVAGSGWAPTPDVTNPDLFPLQFEVDYIRVYQRDAYKNTATYGRP